MIWLEETSFSALAASVDKEIHSIGVQIIYNPSAYAKTGYQALFREKEREKNETWV